MKEVNLIDKLFTPADGKILIKADDTYDLTKTESGVFLANAAHEDAKADFIGYNLTDWIIRKGKVVRMPDKLIKGSYDWFPQNEIKTGDTVLWPHWRFFDYHFFKTLDGQFYIMVDYMDIYAKMDNDNNLIPVNGYYMFSREKKIETALAYSVEKDSDWYILENYGKDVVFEDEKSNYNSDWKIGDECFLSVPPIQVESNLIKMQDKDYYMCQKKYILLAKRD